MKFPEPCLSERRCRTPVACNEFGYCRERSRQVRGFSMETVNQWRFEAIERRIQEEKRNGKD